LPLFNIHKTILPFSSLPMNSFLKNDGIIQEDYFLFLFFSFSIHNEGMKQFSILLPTGESLNGVCFKKSGSTSNLVIQTGMAEHSERYAHFAEYLNEYLIDVYVLDAFGQGRNAKSVEDLQKWPKDAFAKNVEALRELVKKLKVETKRPTYLMGHSMGSFMVQSYLERFPNTVDKAVICGSNGPCLLMMKSAYIISRLIVHSSNWDKPSKFLQGLGIGAYEKSIKARKTKCDWLSFNEENVNTYLADPYCGATNTNGFWREFLKGMASLYTKKNETKISPKDKILIVSGSEDPVGECGKGPKNLLAMYKDRGVNDVSLILYEGMRHEILNELDNKKVYKDIKDFLLRI